MVGFIKPCILLAAFLGAMPSLGYAQEQLPDPTRPALGVGNTNTPASPSSSLRLESVILGKQRQQAIISGETYQVGQMVGSAKLIKISPQAVSLQQDGRVQTLSLFPGLEKTPVNNQTNISSQHKKTLKQ